MVHVLVNLLVRPFEHVMCHPLSAQTAQTAVIRFMPFRQVNRPM